MTNACRAAGIAISAIFATRIVCAQTPDRTSITLAITEEPGAYLLTVPVSRLVMRIPKQGLSRGQAAKGGATTSPRYFYFEDRDRSIQVSGWFESAQGYPGFRKSWDEEVDAWKQKHLPVPRDVVFDKVGPWETASYDAGEGKAAGSHVRAHVVRAGTWIDAHLSIISDAPQADRRASLRRLLESIQVDEKKE